MLYWLPQHYCESVSIFHPQNVFQVVKNVVCSPVNSTKCICTGQLKTEQINYEEERKKGEKGCWALLELQMLIHKFGNH